MYIAPFAMVFIGAIIFVAGMVLGDILGAEARARRRRD
jgi:hypothetical protein